MQSGIALHYDMKNIREVTVIYTVDPNDFYASTNKGKLPKSELFPLEAKKLLEIHFDMVRAKRAELVEAEGRIYQVLNATSKWRHNL